MKFVQLSKTEFQNDVHLVGVKDNVGTVIAACLLTEAQALIAG